MADTVRNTVGVLLVVAVGYVMGFRFDSIPGAVGMVALVVGLGYAFSWVGAWIGARIRNAETVGMLSMFWLFPLMLASSAFVPTAGMHEFVRLFAEYQPVSVVSDAARALAAGTPADGAILGSLAWIVGPDPRLRLARRSGRIVVPDGSCNWSDQPGHARLWRGSLRRIVPHGRAHRAGSDGHHRPRRHRRPVDVGPRR